VHPDIVKLCARTDLGLAPHYAALWAMVHGLEAKRVFEFGAGGSTRVILDALPEDGVLISNSTDSRRGYCDRFGFTELPPPHGRWLHLQCLSEDVPAALFGFESLFPALDLVLHDGSHSRDVVFADLSWILPQVRQFGLVVVHDTQYQRCAEGMIAAVIHALVQVERAHDMLFSHTTLPYGAGLTIIRVEKSKWPARQPMRCKDGDPSGWTRPRSL